MAGLAACLGLIYGAARFDDIMRNRANRSRAREALAKRSRAELLAEIDRRIEEIDEEIATVRKSAAAYSTVGNAMGSVASLYKEMTDLEEYRKVVAKMAE